jgi:hypothetical protein
MTRIMKAADKDKLIKAGMPAEKIREVDSWVRSNRRVVVRDRDIFTIDAEIGSLEILEL